MILLIDADIIKYRAAASIEKKDKETEIYSIEPVHHAYYNVNSIIRRIFKELQTTKAEFFLTKQGDKTNYRYKIYDQYKANRKDVRIPFFLKEVHNYILKHYRANEAIGQEADDEITIRHYEYNTLGFKPEIKNSCIVSIDKDFNNVPGWHYNMIKKELYFLSELEAKQNFYLQILTGDSCDNIPRIKKGWRQKKVEEQIRKCLTERELVGIVMKEIKIQKNEWECNTRDYMQKIGQLVHLRTKQDDMWRIPI